MDMLDYENEVKAEMASVSVAASVDLLEMTSDNSALGRLQDKLNDSKSRVETVKQILEETEDHNITPELAENLDNLLNRSFKDIGFKGEEADELNAVGGVECLGLTLSPSEYKRTRLAGCEGFLDNVVQYTKDIVARIGKNFKDSKILLNTSAMSLTANLDKLEEQIKNSPEFNKDAKSIQMGSRLFNLFKIGEGVSGNWISDLDKVNRSITGLNNNYYLNGKNTLNAIVSYFGSFDDDDDEAAEKRLLMFHKAVSFKPFKECNIADKDHTNDKVVGKRSVDLLGGAYFVDTRLKELNLSPTKVDDMLATFAERKKFESTFFFNNPKVVSPTTDKETVTVTSNEIKAIVSKSNDMLKTWIKSFEVSQSYMMSDGEFLGIMASISKLNLSKKNLNIIGELFVDAVLKNQIEAIKIRVATHAYLMLLVSGLVELANKSIKVNS